jgi:ribosomal protein S21
MPTAKKPRAKSSYYDQDLSIDFRASPHLYRIGKGEQGVLMIEPYKTDIGKHWRFKTPEIARASAEKLLELYNQYKEQHDFPGMDMTRKFLQMGSMRYANHKGGRKYHQSTGELLPQARDEEKAESAMQFHPVWKQVEQDPVYQEMRQQHVELYEKPARSKKKKKSEGAAQ